MTPEEKDLKTAGGYSDDAAAARRAAAKEEAQQSGDSAQEALGRPGEGGGETGQVAASADAAAAVGESGGASSREARDARGLSRIRQTTERLSGQIKGLSGNRRLMAAVLGGGGLLGIIFALFLMFAQFKLIHMMENLADHLFSRNKHMFEARRDMYMREFYNNHLGQPDRNIDDSTATLTQQIMRRLKDGLEPRLQEKYEIKVRGDVNNPGYKIVTFTDKISGEVTEFNTATQKKEARAFNKKVAAEITQDDGWMKRIWYKGRMSRVTGTKWNWLDPIKQKGNAAKVAAANQVAKFLMSSQSKASGISKQLTSKLFGGNSDFEDAVNEETTNAAGEDNAEKILSRQVIETASKAVTGVGLAVLAVQIGCAIDGFLADDPIKTLSRQKTEIEYMTQYAAMISKSSQLKRGETDGETVNAHMSLLTYTDEDGRNHDVAESNNYQRATGKTIPYEPTDNCKSYKELCEGRQPGRATSENGIAKTFTGFASGASSVYNSDAYQVAATIIPLPGIPGSLTTDLICSGFNSTPVQTALSVGSNAVDAALSAIPGVNIVWGKVKDVSGDLVGAMGEAFFGFITVSAIDADTVGPFLAHASGAGGSLAAASVAGSPVGTEKTGKDSEACHNKSAEEKQDDDSFCGVPLSKDELAYIDRKIAQEEYEIFRDAPLDVKIASTETPYSLISRMIEITPASPKTFFDRSADTMIASINPRSWIKAAQSLPELLMPRALAYGQSSMVVLDNGTDQYNTRQYGIKPGDLEKPLGDSGLENIDRNVGCSMIAGLKNKDMEPIERPAKCREFDPVGTASGDETGDTGATVSGTAQELADQILKLADEGKIQLAVLNSADESDRSTPKQNLEDTKNGSPAKTTSGCGGRGAQAPNASAEIDVKLLKFLAELGEGGGVQITTLVGQCHSTPNSQHYKGKAVDFGCPFNTTRADRIARKYGVSRNFENCAAHRHYHYSVGGG